MLSLTETPTQVTPKSEMAAEMARRIAASNPPAPPTVVPVASVPPVEVPKTASGAEGKTETGAAATPTTPVATPPANAGQDVSFVPEKIRHSVEKLDPEVIAWMRDNALRQSDYTKKTMALAEERKQIEARKMAADYGELILKDRNLRRMVEDAAEAEAPKPEPFDPLSATPEQFTAKLEATRKEAAAEALKVIEEREKAQQQHVTTLRTMANMLHEEFVKSGEYDDAAINQAYDALESNGVKFSPENVVSTLRLVLPKKQPAAKASPPVPVPAQAEANGASALTRGAGVSAPLKVPAVVLENRLPTTYEEKVEVAKYLANQIRAREGKPPLTF